MENFTENPFGFSVKFSTIYGKKKKTLETIYGLRWKLFMKKKRCLIFHYKNKNIIFMHLRSKLTSEISQKARSLKTEKIK